MGEELSFILVIILSQFSLTMDSMFVDDINTITTCDSGYRLSAGGAIQR